MFKEPQTQTLTDGRVRIRRLDLTDVDTIFEAVQASMVPLSAWMPWAHPGYSRDDAAWFSATTWLNWRNKTAFEFVVEDAADGRFLGMCGLNGVSVAERRANLGYWVRVGENGRGVCTAATRLVARFGFQELGLVRIRLFHAAGNIGSQRVAEKVGFVLEGVQRKRLKINGVLHDTKLYSLVDISEVVEGA